jgi:hypothetical protein
MSMSNAATQSALILALSATACLADGFDGVYEYGFCDDPPFVALTIEGEAVAYYETPCTLSGATPLADPAGAVQYTMTCEQGSTTQENTVVLFFDAEGGLVMRTGDLEDRFVSCGES